MNDGDCIQSREIRNRRRTGPRRHGNCVQGRRSGHRAYRRREDHPAKRRGHGPLKARTPDAVPRDIKPANLMLTADDTVKITDFGTAKILQFGTVQQTAHVMGTPSYMSPEQVKGRAVDGRSDIFSLGVMLYEMVTGEKPFPGQNITTVIYKIVNEDPVPPKQVDPSIHAGISAVVM